MVRLCDVMRVSDQILLFDLNMFQFGEFLRIHNPLLFTELGFKIPRKKQKSVNYLLPSSQNSVLVILVCFLCTNIVIGATCFFPSTV